MKRRVGIGYIYREPE